MGTTSAGAVQVSLGLVSNFSDVYPVMQLARGLLDRSAGRLGCDTPL